MLSLPWMSSPEGHRDGLGCEQMSNPRHSLGQATSTSMHIFTKIFRAKDGRLRIDPIAMQMQRGLDVEADDGVVLHG